MIPCMMMVLGAVLHRGPGSAQVPARLILGVSAFRLIIIPLAGEFPPPSMPALHAGLHCCLSGPLRQKAHHPLCRGKAEG